MKRYKLFRSSFDFAGRPLLDDLVEYEQGNWVRYEEAQAEIERLQAIADERGRRMEFLLKLTDYEWTKNLIPEAWDEVAEWFNEDGSLR